MKILYIYRDYKGRRKKYGEMMERCGHKVKYLKILEKKIKNQVNIKDIKKYSPDIVWIYTPYYVSRKVISDDAINYIKSKKIYLAMYATIDPEVPYIDELKVWKKIDFLFVQYKPLSDFLRKNNLNAHYIPLGFYPDQYYKIINKKKYDVTFMGTSQSYSPPSKDERAKFMQSLSGCKYTTVVFGESFKGRVNGIPVKSFKGHNIQRLVFSQSKINLDLPVINYKHSFYKNKYHLKNRSFEIPATGNFLLTLKCSEYLNLFPEDTVGYYDNNIESFKENIDKYLKDKNIRKKMAERAYKLVHEKHTYLHRFKDMFKIIAKEI